ncbi:universal stress protein [Bifidobacterium castoris]|uniref:Universal stress protein n=1 Tax=Bifidobacterium castoris TaxID=2306972 RepID=A0A430F7A1_9BIFI|nr:universal stress protein [Bifidobacterium castoris]RSX48809.1 universal stress protein [Bifidobacterium castoris]
MNAAIDSLNPSGDIVVGVDGSPESFSALRWSLQQARLSGQRVNAVYGWSYSWDMGPEPANKADALRERIADELHVWVEAASKDMDLADEQIELTSFRAAASTALLEIGANAQQIVIGRRSMSRVARWLLGSLSSSLAEEASVPVTIIRSAQDEDIDVQDQIANALSPNDQDVHFVTPHVEIPRTARPIVVGVDGSDISRRALVFAAGLARLNDAPLHVMFFWRIKDLDTVPGYETSVAPMDVAQKYAMRRLEGFIDDVKLPKPLDVTPNAFHISPGKGLVSASRYARHVVVGSRGLSGLDAHFLGSVSKQVINSAECNVTVVH